MAKLSKLQRSNLAHKRLAKKHARKSKNNVVSWIKNGYHNDVLRRQQKEKRILSADEKRYLYKVNEHFAFN